MIGLSGSRGLVARAVTNALRKGLTTNQQPCWRSFPAASIDGLRNYHAVDGDKIPYDRDRAQLLKEIGEVQFLSLQNVVMCDILNLCIIRN
jgi:hypothetical protein